MIAQEIRKEVPGDLISSGEMKLYWVLII